MEYLDKIMINGQCNNTEPLVDISMKINEIIEYINSSQTVSKPLKCPFCGGN